MAELLRIEPSKFCEGEAWFVFDDGRSYLRPIDAQEHASSAPMIIKDTMDETLSHADGKIYTSKAALYASYRENGNPQGVRYECVGEKVAEPYKRPARTTEDRHRAMQSVTRTLDEMGI